MLPFCRIDKSDCISLSVELSYGCLDCGHNAICFRLGFLWWTLIVGVEFGK